MKRSDEVSPQADTWALYKAHGPVLLQIARAVCSTDRRLGPAEAEDLLQSFIVEQFARVASASLALPPGDRARYVRASFRNYLRSAARNQARRAAALQQVAQEMPVVDQDVLQSSEREREEREGLVLASRVRDAIKDLPPGLARPAALYLGLDGPRQSIREIARALGLTRYLAHLATLDGLVAVAVRLNVRDLLSDHELEAARLVLLEGNDLDDAARSLGLTRQQVHGALTRARDALAGLIGREKGMKT